MYLRSELMIFLIVVVIIIVLWFSLGKEEMIDWFTPGADGKPKAIVVIRHADDNGPQDYVIPRTAELPDGTILRYTQKRLSASGIDAAEKYAYFLPKLMDDLGLSAINRV